MNAFTVIEPGQDIGNAPPAIGTPCDTPGSDAICYVVNVAPATANTFTLIGGPLPMSRDHWQLTIANDADHLSELSENIAAAMGQHAGRVCVQVGVGGAGLCCWSSGVGIVTGDNGRRALASLALGRILRMGARPEQPGDAEEYQRCRSIVLDNMGPCPFDLSENSPYHGSPSQ